MLVLKWAVSYYADLHTDAGTELDALRGQLMRDVTKFSQEQPAMAGGLTLFLPTCPFSKHAYPVSQ